MGNSIETHTSADSANKSIAKYINDCNNEIRYAVIQWPKNLPGFLPAGSKTWLEKVGTRQDSKLQLREPYIEIRKNCESRKNQIITFLSGKDMYGKRIEYDLTPEGLQKTFNYILGNTGQINIEKTRQMHGMLF